MTRLTALRHACSVLAGIGLIVGLGGKGAGGGWGFGLFLGAAIAGYVCLRRERAARAAASPPPAGTPPP